MAELERSKRLYTDVGDDQEGLALVQARLTSGKASLVPIMYASLKHKSSNASCGLCFNILHSSIVLSPRGIFLTR